MKYLESARDKVLMGPERKSRIPDEEANLITAYHEGGHAIVAFYTKDSHPLHKVTIIPRGPSLGHTAYIPEKERYHVTKSQLQAMMDTMMGGRAAEELIFGPEKITSGNLTFTFSKIVIKCTKNLLSAHDPILGHFHFCYIFNFSRNNGNAIIFFILVT